MKPPAQHCVGGFFLLYCNRARGDADEPINPVLVNESRGLSCFITLWVGLLFSPHNESSPTLLARLTGFEGTSGIPLALSLRWYGYNISPGGLHVNCLIVEIR